MQNYLFIGGVARSGTSALCEMLNCHPEIAMGMERYKSLAANGELFSRAESLFVKEKFFDFEPCETNVPMVGGKYDELYRDMERKFQKVTYVGDKVPSYYKHVDRLMDSFPGAKIIIIWRALVDVAMSWERRSKDTSSWPSINGMEAAAKEWSVAMDTIIQARENHRGSLVLLDYEDVFKVGNPIPKRLINWLGLEMTEDYRRGIGGLRKKAQAIANNRENASQEALDLASQSKFIEVADKLKSISI